MRFRLGGCAVALVLVLSACGSGDDVPPGELSAQVVEPPFEVAPTALSRANSRARWATDRATVPAAVRIATMVAMPPKEPPIPKRVCLA